MDYARPPLLPKHKGAVQLPVVIREISDPSLEVYYLVSVHPGKLHAEGFNPKYITIQKCEWTVLTHNFRLEYVTDLNQISDVALRQFVFIDNGSFYNVKLDGESAFLHTRRAEKLNDRQLFNLSNVFSPLRIYRLRRTYESSIETEKNTTLSRTCNTTWEMEIIDHSEYTPCSRTGFEWLVVGEKQCLYLFGGITILADTDFQGSLDKIGVNWFYFPVNDVWRYDFSTKSWTKIIDFVTNRDKPSSVERFFDSIKHRRTPLYLYDITLIWDYTNDRIYGCYRGKETTIFSMDPSSGRICTEKVVDELSEGVMFISYNYDKLGVQFLKKTYVFKIRQDTRLNRAMHLSRLLYLDSFHDTYSNFPLRYYRSASFLVTIRFAGPSQVESDESVFGVSSYRTDYPYNFLSSVKHQNKVKTYY